MKIYTGFPDLMNYMSSYSYPVMSNRFTVCSKRGDPLINGFLLQLALPFLYCMEAWIKILHKKVACLNDVSKPTLGNAKLNASVTQKEQNYFVYLIQICIYSALKPPLQPPRSMYFISVCSVSIICY